MRPNPTVKVLLCLTAAAVLGVQFLFWSKLAFDVLRIAALCCAVLVYSLWNKREKLTFESGPLSTLAGAVLLGLLLYRSVSMPGTLFASLVPLAWGVALALLASGLRGIRQYWQELLIMAFLAIPSLLRLLAFDVVGMDVSPFTALAGTGIVRFFGVEASVHDVIVTTNSGPVAVYEGCSGVRSMFFLFGLAFLLLIIFPPKGVLTGLATLVAAVAIAFIVNAFRVALLIQLVSAANRGAFEFWHKGDGALLFESGSVFIFILLYRFLVLGGANEKQDLGHNVVLG